MFEADSRGRDLPSLHTGGHLTLTITDLFCGAGGSTTGLSYVPGMSVRVASNHWPLAIDSHGANHPHTDHVCADISQIDPRRFPKTDILWGSPECTHHSQASGKKRNHGSNPDENGEVLPDDAAERSRATMWDIPRFAERHEYRAIITENVVDAAKWVMFPAWLNAMDLLGYNHQIVYLNSMHAGAYGEPAPQSRDRMYVIFHRKGDLAPDVEKWTRPNAWCSGCGTIVAAVQSWKKPDQRWGRYKAQYVYQCPNAQCRAVVEPAWLPAASAIDWTIPAERIGDRKLKEFKDKKTGQVTLSPLAPKTMQRIREGVEKFYGVPQLVPAGGTWHSNSYPVTDPMRTRLTREMEGLLVPVEGRDGKQAQSASSPLRTQTARNETGLFVVPLRNHNTAKPITDPFDTFAAAGNHHGVAEAHSRAIEDCGFRMLQPHEISRGMAFPEGYTILGNKREQVRQAGNAVTPPAARDLGCAVAEALGYEIGDIAA
ncbi:DNA cytosine methyltransferase [Nocardia sp. NPDC059246]|uniref:DNA cytosine methyltransferase n=1 Tax=unclassified Nocardia TaxID=2637762 RepID=UPI00369BA1E7